MLDPPAGAWLIKSNTSAATQAPAASSRCELCQQRVERHVLSCACSASFHVECLAQQFSEQQGGGGQGTAQQALPEQGRCPCCAKQLLWIDLLAGMQSYGWATPKRRAPGRRR
jgi:hypothetical protein